MANVFITTIDNPFDPFEQFEDWNRFDEDHGYFTLSYLARVANTATEMSEDDYNKQVELGVDEILKYDVLGIYKKFDEGDRIYPVRG